MLHEDASASLLGKFATVLLPVEEMTDLLPRVLQVFEDDDLLLAEDLRQKNPSVHELKASAGGNLKRSGVDEITVRIDRLVVGGGVDVQVDL